MSTERESNNALFTLVKDSQVNRSGLHRGIIENIDDSDRLGRVQVRIWTVHGDTNQTPTSALPWAEVMEFGGGGFDYGSFNPPPVGSSVWVGFEDGHEDFPVVLGTFRGVPKRNSDNPNIFLIKDGKPPSEKAWLPPDDTTETPKDIFDGVWSGDPHPTRRVWQKSYKGHTILVEDGDGKEFLKIIDRSGQVIEMICPVDTDLQAGNLAQRGVRDTTRGDALPHSALRDNRALIRIKDLSGQEVMLDARDHDERVYIRSISRDGSGENVIEMRSGKGKELIEIRDSSSNKIRFDPNSDQSIRIEDSIGNKIVFDKASGKVQVLSKKLNEEVSAQKVVTVNGKCESEIKGDDKKVVQGNKTTSVVNDLNLGVLGNTSVNCGGSLNVIVTNQQVASPPALPGNGLKVSMVQPLGCDFAVSNVNGNMTISTLKGDCEFSTIVGDVLIKNPIGEIKISSTGGISMVNTAGNVDIGSMTGTAMLAGNLGTLLGGNAATEPFVCGTKFLLWMTEVLGWLLTHQHVPLSPMLDPNLTKLTTLIPQMPTVLSTNIRGL